MTRTLLLLTLLGLLFSGVAFADSQLALNPNEITIGRGIFGRNFIHIDPPTASMTIKIGDRAVCEVSLNSTIIERVSLQMSNDYPHLPVSFEFCAWVDTPSDGECTTVNFDPSFYWPDPPPTNAPSAYRGVGELCVPYEQVFMPAFVSE